jgi:hypothetical protein
VEEEQEARTNDDTIKQVDTIQMAPFFTLTSVLIIDFQVIGYSNESS